MPEPRNDTDIISALGNVRTTENAWAIFRQYMDDTQMSRISKIHHPDVLIKIANTLIICNPRTTFINTGSSDDIASIRQLSIRNNEEKPLSIKDHTIHFDLEQEQGRIVDRTFYIADENEKLNSLANRIDRISAREDVKRHMWNIMKDKTMIIGFYMRGPIGSPVSNPALEITSSAYVSHSAEMLYRNAYAVFDRVIKTQDHFFTNIHSEGLNRPDDLPDARVFMDRKHRTTFSWKCTYAGNTLLLKKGNHRFAVDKAVYENRGVELSEHMFITGIHGPDANRTTWFAGAAPSGCGKTTTAMAGNVFIGDDLAQMWIHEDGSIRSVNPERGIFGIVEDVNQEGDPLLMQILRNPGHEVIWSNVLIDENKVPHWVGNNESHPSTGFNFQGPWHTDKKDDSGKSIPISHPNARCTIRSDSLKNYSPEAENPGGVLTRVFTYSGRDADTMPPVWVAPDPARGVVIGACIVSAATATEVGASGIKRAPWANAPFIPGSLGEYMDAQFKFFCNKKINKSHQPVMAGLNYFLTDSARGGDTSNLLGEKRDVKVWLAWLEQYAHNEMDYLVSPIGHLPKYEDLRKLFKQIIDKNYSLNLYTRQFALYMDKIIDRIDLQIKAYSKESSIPDRLFKILTEQKKELFKLRDRYGKIITPAILLNESDVQMAC